MRACRSSGGVRVVGPVCSSHDCWPVAVLSSRLVVTGPLLLCRCSTVGLLGSGSLVHRSSCHWSVTALLLLCLIAHRCSAACLSPVRHSSAVRSLLVRLLLCRCSACLSITGCRCHVPVQGHRSVAHPSARASLVRLLVHYWSVCSSLLCRWSVCWSRGHWSVVRASLVHLLESSLPCHLAPLGTVFASVRLFGCSTVRFYTPLVLTSFCSAARLYSPCAHSYSICWLSLAATLFTHSVPHVVSRQWVITHSLSHVLESFERRSGS